MRQSLGEPDPFRLRYRTQIAKIVAEVVVQRMDRRSAGAFIQQEATDNVAPADRARFIEVVETEIMSLHEGNIARYRLRPSHYWAWREVWR